MVFEQPHHRAAAMALPVLRTQPGSVHQVTLQSEKVLYLGTHWFNAQLLCAGEDCPACDWSPSKCRGFAIGLAEAVQRQTPVLIEASAGSWSRVEGLRQMEGLAFKPGLRIEIGRRKRNSPLRLEPYAEGGPVEEQYRAAWRMVAALAVIFRLPIPRPDEDPQQWALRVKPAAVAKLAAAMKPA